MRGVSALAGGRAPEPVVSTPPSVDFAEVLRRRLSKSTPFSKPHRICKSASELGDESVNLQTM